jgi:hypothetical protein
MLDQAKVMEIPAKLDKIGLLNEDTEEGNWPMVPMGATLWCLMSDKRGLAPLIRAWVTGVVEFALRNVPHLITFCPNHKAIPLRTPPAGKAMKCEHCNFFMCGLCMTWHDMNIGCAKDPPGMKRCPGCRIPVEKISGCNRITCRCGKSFCWLCFALFATPGECYAHLNAVHGGYF